MNKIKDFIKNHVLVCIIVFVILLIVIIVLILPKSKANDKDNLLGSLENLGRRYYEDFYYPSVANTDELEPKKAFLKNFNRIGMIIDLDDLLRYNETLENKDTTEFKNKKKKQDCDRSKTRVIIYPKDDYGQKDYDIEVKLDCGFDD